MWTGAGVKMEHFQAALDPRKQELLEARFLGAKVLLTFDLSSGYHQIHFTQPRYKYQAYQCNGVFSVKLRTRT